jgi:hypothetical protein
MKKNLFTALLIMVLPMAASAQSQEETIHKTGIFPIGSKTRVLSVDNIQGFVHIEAYAGDKVELTAEKKITAQNQPDVTKGMEEVQVKLNQSGDSIYVFVEAPFVIRKKKPGRQLIINLEDSRYNYEVNLTLRVPANVNLVVSSVSNGDIKVENITGNINARHVNGPITLTGVAGNAQATTVNGRIDVFYKANPTADARFKTINGNVNVHYAPQINANVAFKTLNGQFYTDLSEVELMPVQVVKNSEGRGEGTIFRINKSNSYKIGAGGPALSFETLNGNIYLKKN